MSASSCRTRGSSAWPNVFPVAPSSVHGKRGGGPTGESGSACAINEFPATRRSVDCAADVEEPMQNFRQRGFVAECCIPCGYILNDRA